MTTGATGQLGLALPVQGELSGTWGDTVNNGITQYTNIAIAGTLTLTNDGAVTLANTTGDASASNITSTLTGAGTVTAQFAIVKVTGTLTVAKVVTGPSYSKTYTVVNSATGGIVTFKASGQTGVSVAVGETAFVYFNGTDYVKVVGTATAGAAGGSNTQVQFNSSGILAGSANMTFNGTTLTAAGFSGPLNGTVGATTPAAGTFTQLDITAQGPLRLQDTTGGEYVGLRAPASLGASYTLTWPADDGILGQALITDGSGGLSWSTAASGDVYGPASATANGIVLFDGTTGKIIKDSAAQDGLIYGLTVGRGGGAISTNTVVGAGALAANTTGANSVAIGQLALNANTTGTENTSIGRASLFANTTGNYNSALGVSALTTNTTGSNNTAIGWTALALNTTASNNTAVGYQAGYNNTTGTGLVAIGSQALLANTTGSYNTAIGYALVANTTGGQNIGIGLSALEFNTTASFNTSVGVQALRFNTTGQQNTAFGKDALYKNTTASQNTAVGFQAAYNNTTGDVTAFGYSAAFSSTTAVYNTAFGNQALYSSTGGGNTAFGSVVLYANTTGVENVGIGSSASTSPSLRLNTTGSYNIAVGAGSLSNNVTSSANTAVGYQAGFNATSPDNTFVGYQAGKSVTTGSNNITVGPNSMDNSAGITGSDNIGIGRVVMRALTSGANNVAVGNGALLVNTTGSNNIAIGYQASYNNTTGISNTAVGYQAGYTNQTGTANTFVGLYAGYVSNVNGNAYNTCIGSFAGYNLTTGVSNTFIGTSATAPGSSGSLITTGSKNTIIGAYNGNQGGLDIRTSSNYIVLSDGDGNPLISTTVNGSVALQGATPATGTGITFPATQSDSSNPNTLDDYEQGTFSPILFTSGTNFSSVTYIAQTGYYTKIGNKVFIEILLGWGGLSGSPTGDLLVGGLPFTVNSSSTNATFATQCYFIVFPTLVPSATYATMQVSGGSTYCLIRASGNNTDWTSLAANAQTTTGDHYFRASGSYTV
jgi:hypothetical protein